MSQTIHINEIELFNLLKGKLGDREAEGLVHYVKTVAAEELKRNVETLATREFVKDEINNVRLEIREFKSEILRWMFIYWTGTVLALLGGMFAFVKFFLK